MLEQRDEPFGLLQGLLLHLLPTAGDLLLGFEQEAEPVSLHQESVLKVDGEVVLVEDLPFEEPVSGVDQDVVSLYVAVPAIFLVEVLIDRLPVFVDGDRLSPNGVGLFEVVLSAQPFCSAQ